MGPEIYRAFIDAAGGNESLLVTVPNAGGGDAYPQDGPSTRGWKQAGATRVHTYFTKDRTVADADSFVAVLQRAGGVWFEGGRQFRLVDAYGGTKSEAAFNAVLARGGVVGGSSAGASILGDFLVRGAPSNNNFIMDYPGYQKGFAYLKEVGIDQHVVARERLADLADSIIPRYPQLLGISEDEGTAWVIRGDTGTIIGRSKAFVYNGRDANDAGKPFLTLFPGDVYDLGARRVMRRAYEGSAVTPAFLDALFAPYRDAAKGGATVLVAQDGKVLADRAYGIAPQPRYMPETTVPQFALGEMSAIFTAVCEQLPEPPARARPATDSAAPPCGVRAARRAGRDDPAATLCLAARGHPRRLAQDDGQRGGGGAVQRRRAVSRLAGAGASADLCAQRGQRRRAARADRWGARLGRRPVRGRHSLPRLCGGGREAGRLGAHPVAAQHDHHPDQ